VKLVIVLVVLLVLPACKATVAYAPPLGVSLTMTPLLPPYPSAAAP
jgi:hypothetical protein